MDLVNRVLPRGTFAPLPSNRHVVGEPRFCSATEQKFPVVAPADECRSTRSPRRGGRLVAGVATTICLLSVPTLAGASARHAAHMLPATSVSCGGVSAAAVSSALGWTVPAPTSSVTSGIWSKGLDISGTTTTCTYGPAEPTSIAALEQRVIIRYSTLSTVPPVAQVVAELEATFKKASAQMPPGATFTYKINTKHSIKTLYAKVSVSVDGHSFTGEFDFGWKGTHIAGVEVSEAVSTAQLGAVEKLAESNGGV